MRMRLRPTKKPMRQLYRGCDFAGKDHIDILGLFFSGFSWYAGIKHSGGDTVQQKHQQAVYVFLASAGIFCQLLFAGAGF